MYSKLRILPSFVWHAPVSFLHPKGSFNALSHSRGHFQILFLANAFRQDTPKWVDFDQVAGVPEVLAWFAICRCLRQPVINENRVIRQLKKVSPGYIEWEKNLRYYEPSPSGREPEIDDDNWPSC